MRGGNNIKKRTKIILIILLVIVAALGVLAYNNRSCIKALCIAINTSSEELAKRREELDSIENLVKDYEYLPPMRDMTEEEKGKLASGELSKEEAIDLILGILEPSHVTQNNPGTDTPPSQGDTDVPNDVVTPTDDVPVEDNPPVVDKPLVTDPPAVAPEIDKPVEQAPEPSTPQTPPAATQQPGTSANSANEQIARLVAQLYVVKVQANSSIASLEASMKADYLTIPYAERVEKNLITQYIKNATKILAEWESETDAEVEAILSEIETLLKESGQDLSLVGSLRQAYEDEKTYIKAYYFDKLESS